MLLLIQRPFGLDDRIQVGKFDGVVTDISLRATALRTDEGHEVLIPNADVYSGPITNLTHYPTRRITIPFTAPRTLDAAVALPKLSAALQTGTAGAHTAAQSPRPAVVVTSFDKDQTSYQATFWVPATADIPPMIAAIIVELQQVIQSLQGVTTPDTLSPHA